MSLEKEPFFSIIIPCYNQAHFLNDCVESILIQSFNSWEAIIINDGSQDDTETKSLEYSNKNSRIHYVYQSNQGLSAARNAGIKKASGQFLLFLDADDWLEPSCLATYSSLISTHPGFELYRCGYGYWNKPNNLCFHIHRPSGSGEIFPDILSKNIGPCHSILINKEFAIGLAGFDTQLKSCEDWDFWMQAGKRGASIFSISDVLVSYRYVPDSMSRNPKVMYEALTEVSRRAGSVDPRLPKSAPYNRSTDLDYPTIQKNHLITVLGVMLHQGKVAEALEWYRAEQQKWNWNVMPTDWKRLSSYLSWGYFFEATEIQELLATTKPVIVRFFLGLGYASHEAESLTRMVLAPQLKKRNHLRYGKFLGGVWNKMDWY